MRLCDSESSLRGAGAAQSEYFLTAGNSRTPSSWAAHRRLAAAHELAQICCIAAIVILRLASPESRVDRLGDEVGPLLRTSAWRMAFIRTCMYYGGGAGGVPPARPGTSRCGPGSPRPAFPQFTLFRSRIHLI